MAGLTSEPSFLDNERLYSLSGFYAASGVSATRIREARREGILLPTLAVGKRKFVRGTDGIAFIERLASPVSVMPDHSLTDNQCG